MRPLKITISGFGTYCKKTVIDFTKLGSEGLYLITGDTGSGKTTIFDAITFALFGSPSGSNRDATMLRSSFATADDKTEVELEFQFKGKVYKIKRNPTYERAKKSGEGTTVQPTDAELIMDDGSVVSGLRSVDSKIKEILGITKNQFCQIAMIAQGDFQKLLFETSENRKVFFRTLFKTENYQKLQEKLKDEVSVIKKNVDELADLLNHEMSGISCGENSNFAGELLQAKNDLAAWGEKGDEKTGLINNIISEDKESGCNIEKQISDSQGLLDKIKLQIAEINKMKEDRELALSLEGEIGRKEKLIEQLEGTVTVKKEALDGAGEKEQEKALIKNDLPKYDELDNKIQELKSLYSSISSLEKAVNGAEDKIEKKAGEIKAFEDELNGLKDVAVNHQQFLSEKEKLQGKIESLNDLKIRFGAILNICDKLVKAQEEYKDASDKSVAALDKYSRLNKAYLDGQAGILAQGLEEGKPCPVCGSIHHPAPCDVAVAVPGEDELNRAKDDADRAGENASKKSQAASAVAAEKKAKDDEFVNAWKKVFGAEDCPGGVTAGVGDEHCPSEGVAGAVSEDAGDKIEGEIKSVKGELSKIEDKLNEESSKIKRKNFIEDNLPGERENLEKMKADSIKNSNQLIQNKTEAQGMENHIKELKEGLSFENKAAANNMIIKLEREIDFAKKTYEDALRKYNKEKDSLNEIRGNLGAVKERLNNSDIDNEEDVEKQFQELSQKVRMLNVENDNIKARLAVNCKALTSISENIEKIVREEGKWKMVSSLYYTVGGNLGGGHEKIPLEVYIQTAYLDKILYHANKRLLIMSDNQYELVRRKEPLNFRGKTGLDLDVVDHYNGNVRNVKSLSGGECFQASLALALGLSDEITSSIGGIQIDTMFIDEGFGTLDSETIQKAYKALISVTEVNKLVGIISHVDYLKEKIDKQIVVKKTRDKGSFVTING